MREDRAERILGRVRLVFLRSDSDAIGRRCSAIANMQAVERCDPCYIYLIAKPTLE